jgi:hypothetical protein
VIFELRKTLPTSKIQALLRRIVEMHIDNEVFQALVADIAGGLHAGALPSGRPLRALICGLNY